jgi:hypothetical protein
MGGYGSMGGYSSYGGLGSYGSSYGGYGGGYGMNRPGLNSLNQPNNQDPNKPPQ